MFRNITGKVGNMRKPKDWVVCPVSNAAPNERTIQCDNRIARVNLDTGKVIVSDGKGGHQGFAKLQGFLGAKEYDCPEDIIQQLKNLDEDHGVQPDVVQITQEGGKPVPIVHARLD